MKFYSNYGSSIISIKYVYTFNYYSIITRYYNKRKLETHPQHIPMHNMTTEKSAVAEMMIKIQLRLRAFKN